MLDRHRFAHLFLAASEAPVLEALRPYQSEDGGFGNALEPDLRAPVSQPLPVWSALTVLDESDGFDDPMVMRACDYLQSVARSDGGVPFVLPSAGPYPRAPWWKTEEDPASSLLPTAGLAAFLHKHAVDHPWVEVATDFCWRNIDGLEKTSPYEVTMVLQFLENVDDRVRAEESFARIGPMIDEQGLAELDPQAPGEIHTPLDFAPRPDSIARPLFDDDIVHRHLDHLAEGQKDDGGWMFNLADLERSDDPGMARGPHDRGAHDAPRLRTARRRRSLKRFRDARRSVRRAASRHAERRWRRGLERTPRFVGLHQTLRPELRREIHSD